MSSIRDIAASNPVPVDLANKIGQNGINEILDLFWKRYYDLKKDCSIAITAEWEEDDITQEWYQKLVRRWDERNRAACVILNRLVPYHQYSDNTLKKRKGCKAPIIDFCFKEWGSANSYFGAECKNLYGNQQDKIRRYVETGIYNYTSGKYGSQSSESSVIGYVLSGDVGTCVNAIVKEVRKDLPVMNLTRMLNVKEPQYKSMHKRERDNKNIILYHLFFEFC